MNNLPEPALTQEYLEAVFYLNEAGDRLVYRYTFPMRHWKAGKIPGCYHGKVWRVKIGGQPIDIARLIHLYKTGELLPLVKSVPPKPKPKLSQDEKDFLSLQSRLIAEAAAGTDLTKLFDGAADESKQFKDHLCKSALNVARKHKLKSV